MGGLDKKKRVGDWPAISENQWYALSVVSAIFTAIAVIGAFLYIFADGFNPDLDPKLAQALSPFGVALVAFVTFCTVSWRGSISVRQVNQSENEGRAKLLQEGAKLLSEPNKASHVSAGVASLGVLIDSGVSDYAMRAMNLLADFVEDHMRNSHTNRHREEISGVMLSGENAGFNTGRTISFFVEESDDGYQYDDETTYWHYIPGFLSIIYYGGEFPHDIEYNIEDIKNIKFNNVNVVGWNKISVDSRFEKCRFEKCGISKIASMESLDWHNNHMYAFINCDFSSCIIEDEAILGIDLKRGGNFYTSGKPPMLASKNMAVDWSEVLLLGPQPSEF